MTSPDSPINVAETVADRSATSISFTWDKGSADGGSPVIDFRINYDQGTGAWIPLTIGVIQESYTATLLTAGLTYNFAVEARNTYGFS